MMSMTRRIVLVLTLVLTSSAAFAADANYINSMQQRGRGLDALTDAVNETRPVSRLTIHPEEIEIIAKGDATDFARWSVTRINLLLFTHHQVVGPTSWTNVGIIKDPSGAFFRLHDVDLGKLDQLIDDAIDYAGMRTRPAVTAIEIARAISILPEPSYGDIRWTLALDNGLETATVIANAQGTIIGGDLSNTKRVETLDMLASDNWPMADAQALLAEIIGTARVHEITVAKDRISVTADHPSEADKQRDYSWTLSGVTRGFVDFPNLIKLGMGSIASYELSDVDFTKLPAIKQAALTAFDSAGATITELSATMPTDRASGALRVLWNVDLRQANGETGGVLVDTSGSVVEIDLPDSRKPAAGPWLAPATLVHTLRRIEDAFGPDAKINEISIDDERASMDIEDPLAPGELAQFIIDDKDIVRFGSASFMADLAPEHVFTMRDLAQLTEGQLAALTERTLKRINMDGAEAYRYTISRHALIMDPNDDRLLLEIRVGKNQGNEGGWATYTLDGTEVDVLLP
ncbi:MAG: hypothetical protein ABIQ30_01275 [Devosia sp.]